MVKKEQILGIFHNMIFSFSNIPSLREGMLIFAYYVFLEVNRIAIKFSLICNFVLFSCKELSLTTFLSLLIVMSSPKVLKGSLKLLTCLIIKCEKEKILPRAS